MRSNGLRLRGYARALACAVALAALAQVQPAAAYPDRPITLVVPFAPGGPTDIIGMGQVARATPDGHTLLLASTAIAVNPALFKNLPYDPVKDFAPISELVNAPNVLVVHPDSGINTIADLV